MPNKRIRAIFNAMPVLGNLKLCRKEAVPSLTDFVTDFITYFQVSKISRKQWDYFWDKGFLGEANPTSLLYAVYTLFISVTG